MQNIDTEVLVIGGGATGAGVVRDLAMRGFKTVLVEKGDLTHGTSGRYHGLLHSGGRYVVRDPEAARECIEENRILRRIMPHCIEDTGGFFVVTPWDDPEYMPRFVEGCRNAGIPVEEITIERMLREEPLLNPKITHCFRVPDGSADSFLATDSNAESARQHGAQILTYHQVVSLLREGDRVTGARIHNRVKDEEIIIRADMVVNASGAWAGQISGSAGIPIEVIPGKGTLLAVNHRIINTVVNRCRMPSDADIIVPAHTVAVIGTTDIPVKDPDWFPIEPWEIRLMLEEGEKLVPGFKEMRFVRAWAGVRPLTSNDGANSSNREVTRAFALFDHEVRDGVSGIVTITSGKWTTYRKMAEATVNLVCEKLGVDRPCRTHLEPLPGAEGHGFHDLGTRLARIEQRKDFGNIICECELATYEDVARAITDGGACTIDDIRRDVRLGMGPCQGGFCTLRAAGILQTLRHPPITETNAALQDFLNERWKGLLPILWGQQLRQERLDELIYQSLLNTPALPGPEQTQLAAVFYQPAEEEASVHENGQKAPVLTTGSPSEETRSAAGGKVDVLVIGAGFSGWMAAWQAAMQGKKVRLISKGMGATHWASGCIDVLGESSREKNASRLVASPSEEIVQLIRDNPRHPYALAGTDRALLILEQALQSFQTLCEQAGYPMKGSLERNWLLPTALGTFRPTCLAPESMLAGDQRRTEPALMVGFREYTDFYPDMIAANWRAQGLDAEALTLDLPVLAERRFVTARTLAAMFDIPEKRANFAAALRPKLGKARRVGLPAVLGLSHAREAWRDLEERLGVNVFEVTTLPPSIPGIRLHNLLSAALQRAGGRFFDGMQVVSAEFQNRHAVSVLSEAAARLRPHRADQFILATGGILGGGIQTSYDGSAKESVFDLPVTGLPERSDWLDRRFLTRNGHPVFRAGIAANHELRPISGSGLPLYENIQVTGGSLAYCDPIQERSVEGIALFTGYLAAQILTT